LACAISRSNGSGEEDMTVIFSDGQVGSTMETEGDFSAWTGVTTTAGETATVTTDAPVMFGSNSAKFYHDGVALGANAYVYKTFDSGYAVIYARMYMQRDAAIENQYVIGLYNQANNAYVAQLLLRAGSWRLWYLSTGTTYAYADYASAPAADTTYMVEIYAKISSTEGQVIVYVDGTARITTAATLDNDNYSNVQTLRVGLEHS
jgi:hypothetical protein